MKLVSVVVPTHNRQELLIEAISSVEAQTYRHIEVIVVDDASDPPCAQDMLQFHTVFPLRVLRNDESESSIWCRQKGVKASQGDLIINLDDDDLLAPCAVQMVVDEFLSSGSDKIVFMGVEGFGRNADHFNQIQKVSVEKAVSAGKGKIFSNRRVEFSKDLLPFLLGSVPSAFQRVAITRSNWEKVTALRNRTYMIDPSIDACALKRVIKPPLRDSEWSIYAVALFDSVLLNQGLYRFRCNGQSAVSKPELARISMISQISTLLNIYRNSKSFDIFYRNRKIVQRELSNGYFSLAYYDYRNGDGRGIVKYLWQSFTLSVNIRCVKLLVKATFRVWF